MAADEEAVTLRAVFDCMVYLQAAARSEGPAASCLRRAEAGDVELFISPEGIAELRDVLNRPRIRKRFPPLTDEGVARFFRRLEQTAVVVDPVPELVKLSRDPKDAKYLNLAIAAGAKLVVSRDNDLLDLMTGSDTDAETFRTSYPEITILDPVAFLRIVRTIPTPPPPTDTPDPPTGSPSNGN
jgi:putative PIN family toxin of toxin-antitoxin system